MDKYREVWSEENYKFTSRSSRVGGQHEKGMSVWVYVIVFVVIVVGSFIVGVLGA